MEEIVGLDGISGIEIIDVVPVTPMKVRVIAASILIVVLLIITFILYNKATERKQKVRYGAFVLFLAFVFGYSLYVSCINKAEYIGIITDTNYSVDLDSYDILHTNGNTITIQDK